MKLFTKKEKIVLNSEEQKENLVSKLEDAHIKYRIQKEDGAEHYRPFYIVSIASEDLKKVV